MTPLDPPLTFVEFPFPPQMVELEYSVPTAIYKFSRDGELEEKLLEIYTTYVYFCIISAGVYLGYPPLPFPLPLVAMNDAWHHCVLYTVANYSGMGTKIQVFTELFVCLLKR